MENIREWFKNNEINTGQHYEINYENDSHFGVRTDTVLYLIVKLDNKWMLRVSTMSAFDRWANSIPIEQFFDTDIELCNYLQENQLDIYKTLLKYLSEEYEELDEIYYEVLEERRLDKKNTKKKGGKSAI